MMRRILEFVLLVLALGLASLRGWGMEQLDIDKELRLLKRGQTQLHIPGARYRVAVFSFEDPDGTGLGNALARILSHDILVRSKVSSIGVLRYVGGLSAPAAEELSYYDKVEALTEAQQATVAVWGMVRREGERLVIDTYAQIPPTTLRQAFNWSFALPRAMGGGRLVAQLNPDRILVQRHELVASERDALLASAVRVNQVRARALDTDRVIAELPIDSVYFLQDRKEDWVLVNAGPGRTGWVRATGHCSGACLPLLDATQFVSGLLGFIDSDNPPAVTASLTPDAHAVRDQLIALVALDEAPPSMAEQEAAGFVDRWLASSAGVPPGGAAFGNLRAVIRIVGALKREGLERGQPFDERQLPRGQIAGITGELARASLIDPRNAVVLHNLAVLFGYLQDQEREQLSLRLAQDAERMSRSAGAP